MSINYTFSNDEPILRVVASGMDDNLEQVMGYGMAVMAAAIQSGCSRVLCNELELEYKLGTFDTFESARLISENAPSIARVAIVCNAKNIKDALFWETVASNRGLLVRVFRNIPEAEEWLIE